LLVFILQRYNMSSGRFAAFQDDDSDSDKTLEKPMSSRVHIPSYEDLSSNRADEGKFIGLSLFFKCI
jgi:hypothetical protein